jgi:2,4-dienoyl-CoA reductase-like NADH-dependent reductase (Old Yellow Enzyme family)/thioredoxin reductase
MKASSFPNLFEPIQIGRIEFKNRIVMPPMSTNFGDPEHRGFVCERHKRYYLERAKGGTGLIIVESTSVNPSSSSRRYGLSLYDDQFIQGFMELAELIKEQGAKCGVQLNHGGRIGPMKVDFEGNCKESFLKEGQYYAASPLPHPVTGIVAKEFTEEQLERIKVYFASAAERAKQAGFNLVELHGAHGYLLDEFLSPYTNKRKDRFGGDIAGRSRFPLQVTRRVKEALGDDIVLSYRMSAAEFVVGGLDIREAVYFAKRLEAEGVQIIHVSGGLNETLSSMNRVVPPMSYPRGTLVKYARQIKEAVPIPVIAVQRINTPELADDIIRKGNADLVATGRALIADPHWPSKAREGRADEIRRCIACNQGCIERIVMEESLSCLHNPEVGREGTGEIEKLPKRRRKVVIFGGGVAGMEVAYVLGMRGHHVTLIEKEDRLGGSARVGCLLESKREFGGVIDFLENQLSKLGVEVFLKKEKYHGGCADDIIIMATGARPILPKISFNSEKHCIRLAKDILQHPEGAGQFIVILGGGSVGIEVAEYLKASGKEVTVIEKLKKICSDLGPLNRVNLLERIHGSGIKILLNTSVLEVNEEGIRLSNNGKEEVIPCPDTVVLAMGGRPMKPRPEGVEGQTHCIGDCKKVGNAMDAIHDAYDLARKL